jgi:uncharacterized membrane protein
MKQLRASFVTGLLVLVPLMATIDLLRWFVRSIDASAKNYIPHSVLPIDFPGLGILIALLLVFLVGGLTQNFIGKWFVTTFDHAIRKLPVVGGIYLGIKKFLETILNPQSDKFKGVVLVQFPRAGIYSIGFRTGKPDAKVVSKSPSKTLTNVFVPCTPNPTSGFYLLIPEEELITVDLTVQEAFKIVVSMGIVTSEELFHEPLK